MKSNFLLEFIWKQKSKKVIDSCAGEGPKGDCPILEALEGSSET